MSAQTLPDDKYVELDTLAEAQHEAESLSGAIGGICFPVSIFRQGDREMIAGALPVSHITNLISESANQRSTLSEVNEKKNRPLILDHVDEIANYLVENINGHFILPPLTLNVKDHLLLFTFKEPQKKGRSFQRPAKAGFVVLERGTQIDVSDGQHRKEGIRKALEILSVKDPERHRVLLSSSVAVMITYEKDMVKIHQDFADCSKTRPISPSQLAVYDRRNPANALVLGLADACSLFHEKLDTTSSKLGKTSAYPFLTNQLRQVVKVMLTGTNAEADDVFEAKARRILADGTTESARGLIEQFSIYINFVTECIPEYKEIAATSPGSELKEKLTRWREKGYVSLMGTGLIAIARVLYELRKSQEPEWRQFVERMGSIDWTKGNRGPDGWSARVVTPDGQKVNTGYAASLAAARDIKRMIGWTNPEEAESEAPLLAGVAA